MPPSDPDLTLLRLPEATLGLASAGPPDGPLTILLHGFPEFWYGWRHQIGPLAAAGLRVVALDQRGYGRSSKPAAVAAYRLERLAGDVLAVADAHGAARIRLVGHDWGGILGWWLAARRPERIARLAVLNAPHPDLLTAFLRRHPLQALRLGYFAGFQPPRLPEAALRAGRFLALREALRLTSRPGAFTPEDLARYETAWAEPGALTGMLNWYRAFPKRAPAPGRIRVPTLILWGRKDIALSPDLAETCLAACDEGEVAWFPEATHWLQHEEPEAVNAALAAFLTRPDGG
ncbi:alpha/beta hydrolase fold [Methylobacterium sp. 4-46]|uniref:alpha/beta fold hydrolase n=1 Tax=unclassified Methylobacterium TaxID=2615210 RepID=UPI000165C9DE|nr:MULTISPECIES: alpha/beta fold hydrolase [Methylobacterium]ACA17881.1 alpha/beta hydrolase fold [Methylobacterium sp. 4-46]WFT77182.1 alpha/beta fold hydrolase [Methylobacterium nodulans]